MFNLSKWFGIPKKESAPKAINSFRHLLGANRVPLLADWELLNTFWCGMTNVPVTTDGGEYENYREYLASSTPVLHTIIGKKNDFSLRITIYSSFMLLEVGFETTECDAALIAPAKSDEVTTNSKDRDASSFENILATFEREAAVNALLTGSTTISNTEDSAAFTAEFENEVLVEAYNILLWAAKNRDS